MATRKPAAPAPCPHYVPPLTTAARVTLTAALEDDDFLGTFEGDAIRVHVYGADALRIRRTIREHGTAIYDSPAAFVDAARPEDLQAAEPEHIPLTFEERVQRAQLDILRLSGFFEEAAS